MKRTDSTEVIVLPNVQGAALRVASARLETGLDHEDFAALVEELIAAVREDEQMKLSAIVAPNPAGSFRFMQKDDAAKILERAKAAPRSPTGKYRQGFAEQLAAEFGYTKGQIGALIRTIRRKGKCELTTSVHGSASSSTD